MDDKSRERDTPPLPAHDATILAQSGLTVDPEKAATAVLSSTQQYRQITATALTVAGAAQRLGITPDSIQQCIADRTLWAYTPDERHDLVLPSAQFTATGAVPHLDSIIGLIPPQMHPLGFHRLLTLPQPDLLLDRQSASLIDWLIASAGQPRMLTQATDLVRAATFNGG